MKKIIELDDIILREMNQDDFDDLCDILKDEKTMYAYEHGFSDEEVQQWLDKQINRYKNDGFGLWAMVLKENNKMIGQCGLTIQDFNGKNVVEVGYLLNRNYWHKGYATRCAKACMDYAFNELNIEEVYSIIRDNNIASQNVAKRNGLKKVGLLEKFYYGVHMPHDVYMMKK